MSTASTTLTQPAPQQLSHAVTEIGRLTLQGSSEVYSLGQLALAWLERPEGYRNLEVVANALQAICGAAQRMEELVGTRSTTCIACRKTRRICGEWRLLRRRFSADSGFLVTGLPGHCAPGFCKSIQVS